MGGKCKQEIECSQNGGRTWHALDGAPLCDESVEYRFTPVVLKYRVALLDDGTERWMALMHCVGTASDLEKSEVFVRWITDWTEVTEPPVEKPEPKMKKYERWLNLYNKGAVEAHATPADAETYAGRGRVECRRIEWEVPA